MRIYDEANTTNASLQPFKYNGKELDMMHGLNTYDYGARQYYSVVPAWDRVDPLCEKYYGTSPYVYCHDNPVNRIDPDGRIVKIWYGPKGNEKCYTFTGFHGKKSILVPNNAFVKAVIKSYVYNAKNGGGKKFIEAAYSKKTIYVADARIYNEGKDDSGNIANQITVNWNPELGIITTEGGRQSPATQLEHEIDHALDEARNAHNHLERQNTPDPQYDTKEDRRVVTGSESETAKANGEATRRNHDGTPYRTAGPTTTRPYNPNVK
jgi:RHS repeat-associated protein